MADNKYTLNQIDKRVAQRYIAKGTVDRGDFEKMMADLPDLEGTYDNIAEKVYGTGLPAGEEE